MRQFDKIGRRQFIKLALLSGSYGLLPGTLLTACASEETEESIDPTGTKESFDPTGTEESVDPSGTEESVDPTRKTVLVIGAGVAGLSAGQKLKELGAEVTLLEAQNRIGGRLWTDRSLGSPFEIGAGWIHGPDGNPITTLAVAVSATSFVTEDDSLIVYDKNGLQITNDLLNQLDADFEAQMEMIDQFMEDETDISLEAAINAVNPGALSNDLMLWALTSFTEFDTGGAIAALSADYFDEDEAFNGEDVILPNGFDAILSPLSEGLNIHFENKVQMVEYGDSGVTVTTSQGTFSGDFVVVTLPLGVLKQGSVAFSPALPNSFQNLISEVPVGNVTKVALKFDSTFWDTNTQYFGYMSDIKGKWPLFMSYQTFTDANILVALSFGDYPAMIEQKADAEIQVEIIEILHTMFGSSIPDPTSILVTRWSTNPFSYGAYSYTGVGNTPTDFNNLAGPVDDRLFFAGEHTIFDYHGTVHGAYLSGIEAAGAIGRVMG